MQLNTTTVAPDLMALIASLMRHPELAGFAMVGGSSLALRFGHRTSVDIDLFCTDAFDAQTLANALISDFKMTETEVETNTVRGFINSIKTDFIAHRYPQLAPIEVINDIRLYSLQDVAAMKLNAITNRGSKKDFWDYAELLSHFSHEEMLSWFAQKYAHESIWHVQKSLVYFDDAECDPDPLDARGYTWSMIKERIIQAARLPDT